MEKRSKKSKHPKLKSILWYYVRLGVRLELSKRKKRKTMQYCRLLRLFLIRLK